MTDLFERLRKRAREEHAHYYDVSSSGGDIDLSALLDEAADDIDRKEAEITRLRDALKAEADYCYAHAERYRGIDDERADRHLARGDRLASLVRGDT